MTNFFSLPTIPILLLLAFTFTLTATSRILDDVTTQSPYSLPPLPLVAGPIDVLPSGQAPAMNTDTNTYTPIDQPGQPEPNRDSPNALPSAEAPTLYSDTPVDQPDQPQPNLGPTNALPSGQAPALDTDTSIDQPDQPQPNPNDTPIDQPDQPRPNPNDTPIDQPDQPQPNLDDTPSPLTAPGSYSDPTTLPPYIPTTTSDGTNYLAISFYMHGVLGGSQASLGSMDNGIIANENENGIPFSKANSQAFPITTDNRLPNYNLNTPFYNNDGDFQQPSQTTNNDDNQALGASLQNLMFGSMTVIDDELTDSPELGSGVVGRGQGLYLTSSLDNDSHTIAFTALLDNDQDHVDEDNTITFFGIHRTSSTVSRIAIVDGTGKYESAKGYATIEVLPQQEQHTTDEIDTIAHISVYIYY